MVYDRLMGYTRRTILRVTGIGMASLAGCLGGSSGAVSDIETPTGPVSSAPVPQTPANYRYAVAGSGESDLTVTYFGSWKCPHCARFSTGFLEDLVTEYVAPGRIDLVFRCLAYANGQGFLGPDAPDAARAGLAVWNAEPQSYWRYHETVMQNQPSEGKEWATADNLVAFAKAAGVSATDAVRTAVSEERYESLLTATTEQATKLGVQGTPTLVIGDQLVSPLGDNGPDRTRQVIEQALSD